MGSDHQFDAETLARFDAKVVPEPNTGCWLWSGTVLTNGYAQFWASGKGLYAHRFAYERHIGEIPAGLFVCHHCDTPLCVNPSHLFVGTHTENMRDSVAKGRAARGATHGSRTKPESVPRGDANGARTKPERLARGDANGSRTHPEQLVRGAAHHRGNAKLTWALVARLRDRHVGGVRCRELAVEFGISEENARMIVIGKTWNPAHDPMEAAGILG